MFLFSKSCNFCSSIEEYLHQSVVQRNEVKNVQISASEYQREQKLRFAAEPGAGTRFAYFPHQNENGAQMGQIGWNKSVKIRIIFSVRPTKYSLAQKQ